MAGGVNLMKKYELDIINKLLQRPCPLCKAEYSSNTMLHIFDQRLENGDLNYVIVECRKCGFIHQNPAWNQEFYNNLYSFLFYDLTDRNSYPEYVKQYKVVSSLICNLPSVCAGARILDFGCNDGSFINGLKKDNTDWARDIELIGYDIYLRGVRDGIGFFNSMSKLLLTKKNLMS